MFKECCKAVLPLVALFSLTDIRISNPSICKDLVYIKGSVAICEDSHKNIVVWHKDHNPLTIPSFNGFIFTWQIISDKEVDAYFSTDSELKKTQINPQSGFIFTEETHHF